MLFLARKNLFEQPLRLSFSVFGVALAVMLILVMWSILQGIVNQAGAYVRNTDAQVWVVQEGFTDIAHGFSVVSGAIARALANWPTVVLPDEPTANLDSKTGQEVVEILSDLAQGEGKGVINVSHDPRLTEIASRIVWIEDGLLSERPRIGTAPAVG